VHSVEAGAAPSSCQLGPLDEDQRKGEDEVMFASTKRSAAYTDGASQALPKDGTARIIRGRDVTVTVDSGVVLVTREGDLEDHVLEAGMELRLPRRGVAVAWALEPSTIRVHETIDARTAGAGHRGAVGAGGRGGAGHRVAGTARAA
jgi:hypothetical protein